MPIKNTQLHRTNPGLFLQILGTQRKLFQGVTLNENTTGSEPRPISEIKMSQPIPNIQKLNTYKKYSTLSVTNPGLLLQILGTQESYSRMLHLMKIIQFGTQTNSEIKMSQPIPNIQNLNAYKKYSTSSHQPQNNFPRSLVSREAVLGWCDEVEYFLQELKPIWKGMGCDILISELVLVPNCIILIKCNTLE